MFGYGSAMYFALLFYFKICVLYFAIRQKRSTFVQNRNMEEAKTEKRPRQKGVGKGRPARHGVKMITMTIRLTPENKKFVYGLFPKGKVCDGINNLFTKMREHAEQI